ncbi:class F sortase [Streptomyces sp. ODS05-4]|uniref:class F sortase n=1 Tax=Streptomyces sp. ODS05-4 TaxID=2944939 RepID=UPI00210E44F6|nr:class F sortase [Streptomyces sp. ODS05-4]
MAEAGARGGRRGRVGLLVAACVLLVVGGVLLGTGVGRQQPAPPRVPQAQSGPGTGATSAPAPAPVPEEEKPPGAAGGGSAPPPSASRPEKLVIPALKVSTPLERLGLDGKRAMETPRDPDQAGWYERGAAPGAKGPAVIAGHVTWNEKKAVFFDLARMKAGQRAEVRREDGSTAVFEVTKVAQYGKKAFPSLEVYGNTEEPELRLITCGGDFSAADHYYSDNVVVFAKLVSVREA